MWDQQRLQQYINDQVEESLNLEYKGSQSLQLTDGCKNEISKDVSAFANSNGGIIIYGISEPQAGNKHLPAAIDPTKRNIFSKETLEQIINSRINPTIHGIIIHPVTIGAPANNDVVYVVEIPQSNTAHQASDKKYYRRYNFQSVPMDDWEIKDIINRKNRTQAKVTFRPVFPKGHADIWMANNIAVPMKFNIIITNVGQLVIHHVDFMIAGGPQAVDYIIGSNLKNGKIEEYFTNEIERKITIGDDEFVINTQRMPILSYTFRKIGDIEFSSEFLKSDNKVRITIVTDDNRSTVKLTGKEIYNTMLD